MPRLVTIALVLSLVLPCACGAVQGGADVVGPDASPSSFVIGTNPTGLDDPTRFEPLVDGDALEIEFGFQGLWMVVLAFQTRDVATGLVTVEASVETATEVLGEFGIAKQILNHADDGFDYYLNFFLVVTGPEHVGQDAWVDIDIEDKDGNKAGGTVQVTLTGGHVPDVLPPPPLFPDSGASEGDGIGPAPDAAPTSP